MVSTDLYPIIVELAGIIEPQDGISLLPVLKDKGSLSREDLFWHFPHYHGSGWKPGLALRHEDWKLVVHYKENKFELYNLQTDTGEKVDLSFKMPEKLVEMMMYYMAHIDRINAQLPVEKLKYR